MRIYPAPGISIRESEVLRYLVSRPEETLLSDISRLGALLIASAKPSAAAVAFPLRFEGETPVLEGPEIRLTGKSISRHLAGSSHCVLLVATLGFTVDRLIQSAGQRNAYEALVLDACATDAVESLCDGATERIMELLMLPKGLSLTARFSPGYGDLPLSLQPALLEVADARRAVGLTSSSSLMLTPTKSVTALIGARSPETCAPSQRGCGACLMNQTCPYRKGSLSATQNQERG